MWLRNELEQKTRPWQYTLEATVRERECVCIRTWEGRLRVAILSLRNGHRVPIYVIDVIP